MNDRNGGARPGWLVVPLLIAVVLGATGLLINLIDTIGLMIENPAHVAEVYLALGGFILSIIGTLIVLGSILYSSYRRHGVPFTAMLALAVLILGNISIGANLINRLLLLGS